jgi:hypothetical protein
MFSGNSLLESWSAWIRIFNASVRLRHGDPQGAKPKTEVAAEILATIKKRRTYFR